MIDEPRDEGFTMIEMLVAMALFAVLGTLLIAFALNSSQVATLVKDTTDVTEEARLAVERMTRELRQAEAVSEVLVGSSGRITEITLDVDFNGDGTIDPAAPDAEILTYRWLPDSESLTLTANHAVTRPVLAGGVTRADIRLRSSQWIYDGNGDGTTSWQEIDQSSVGNRNNRPDGRELDLIDLVSVELEVREGDTTRLFTVQADMRNRGTIR